MLRKALATLRNYFRQDIPMPAIPALHEPPGMHMVCTQHEASSRETTAKCVRFLAQVQDYMLNPSTAKHTLSAWKLALTGAEAHCAIVHPLEVTTQGIVAVMESLAPTQEEVHKPRTTTRQKKQRKQPRAT